jgi:acyl-CoA reductase-like NAD-dependent aldehyde dehydrogenase
MPSINRKWSVGTASLVFARVPQHDNPNRVRAQRLFKVREKQKADAPKAMADYRAAEQRLRDRTQELRRLRIAREARKEMRSG